MDLHHQLNGPSFRAEAEPGASVIERIEDKGGKDDEEDENSCTVDGCMGGCFFQVMVRRWRGPIGGAETAHDLNLRVPPS